MERIVDIEGKKYFVVGYYFPWRIPFDYKYINFPGFKVYDHGLCVSEITVAEEWRKLEDEKLKEEMQKDPFINYCIELLVTCEKYG